MAYQAKQIGEKAHQLLMLSEFRGWVVAVFPSIAYLEGENGEIFWMAGEDVPLHQRSLTVSYSPELLSPGQNFCRQGAHLQIGDHLWISLDQASLWKPDLLDPRKILSLPELVRISQEWLAAFLRIDPPWKKISLSLYSLIASPPYQKINSIIEVSQELIGLGPGFSPAGDDFVGGLLFALHYSMKVYPDHFPLAKKKISNFLAWARPRTNLISWTILKDLSQGQGPEPIHKIINNLLQGEDLNAIYQEVNELIRIGHTTGQAIYDGLLTGLLLWLGADYPKYPH